ncbi:hydroxymyristoyl-ACP dehydratase [Alkaliphilus transvaalensis]|uniref:hydroxymyristoyl-ACP dehydratase n=1 Tax=Alkaliphilus transvaalensis TaxID=114628 RepID=UPI0012EBB9FC|nr:hydroxymyristoyl-ACP dehydratase [Alkaliphilus transvaalensis]
MITICCNNPCLHEKDGNCTLTHVTSVSQPLKNSCAYFIKKTEKPQQKYSKLL